MGDRRMAEIKMTGGSLYLYVHWHGHRLPELAQEAIRSAIRRWDDEPYCARIIVDQLMKDGRDRETGFGLMLCPHAEDEYNHDHPSVIIDLLAKTLTVITRDDQQTTSFGQGGN